MRRGILLCIFGNRNLQKNRVNIDKVNKTQHHQKLRANNSSEWKSRRFYSLTAIKIKRSRKHAQRYFSCTLYAAKISLRVWEARGEVEASRETLSFRLLNGTTLICLWRRFHLFFSSIKEMPAARYLNAHTYIYQRKKILLSFALALSRAHSPLLPRSYYRWYDMRASEDPSLTHSLGWNCATYCHVYASRYFVHFPRTCCGRLGAFTAACASDNVAWCCENRPRAKDESASSADPVPPAVIFTCTTLQMHSMSAPCETDGRQYIFTTANSEHNSLAWASFNLFDWFCSNSIHCKQKVLS